MIFRIHCCPSLTSSDSNWSFYYPIGELSDLLFGLVFAFTINVRAAAAASKRKLLEASCPRRFPRSAHARAELESFERASAQRRMPSETAGLREAARACFGPALTTNTPDQREC
eukprot:4474351-Pleurochrysis_carterae.AAC.1